MQKGKELGLSPIKCENKEGTEKLRELHRRINEILFTNSGKFIDGELAKTIYNALVTCGKELSEMEVPDKAKPKKEELLTKLRGICRNVKPVCDYQLTDSDVDDIQKSINWWMHSFIEQKSSLTEIDVVRLLLEQKRILKVASFLPNGGVYKLKLDNFQKANAELFKKLEHLKVEPFQSLT